MDKVRKEPEEILRALLHRYPQLCTCCSQIEQTYQALVTMYRKKGCLYIAGNGGSAADSEHIAGELMKSFMFQRKLDSGMESLLKKNNSNDAVEIIKRLEGGLAAIPLPSLVSPGTAILNDISGPIGFCADGECCCKAE